MTNTRRFTAFVASVLAVACMAAPMASFTAEAATDYTITINDTTAGHTYEAYQIFSGSLSGTTLGNIVWGEGVNTANESDIYTALKNADEAFSKDGTVEGEKVALTSAVEVAAVLGQDVEHDNALAKKFAAVIGGYLSDKKVDAEATDIDNNSIPENYKITVTDKPGYYLLKDKDNSLSNTNDSYTRYILKVTSTDGVTVDPKGNYPTMEKKIKENVKSTNAQYQMDKYTAPEKYNDVADWNISDDVPFQLIGTLPDNIVDYKGYYYQFKDTLSKGFVAPKAVTDFEVVVHNYDAQGAETKYKLASDEYTFATATAAGEGYTDGSAFTITISNLKAIDNYYTWDSTLNNNAGGWSSTATTTKLAIDENTVITVDYTAKLDVDATIGLIGNPNKADLTYSNNPNTAQGGENDNKGKTPEEFVIAFTYELDVTKYLGTTDTKADDQDKTKAGFKLLNSDKSMVATFDGNSKFTGWVTIETDSDGKITNGTEVFTGADGTFKFIGLDDGTYVLKETTTPDGYNTMADKTMVIAATTVACQDYMEAEAHDTPGEVLTKLELDNAEQDTTNHGVAKTDIINQKGSSLPSTGGMGTTIFYAGGGALVLGAGVLLVTKKRMSNKGE